MPEATSLPTLRHLRLFEAVVRFQSVSAAARALYLSQPAVSIAISTLEKRLGIHLLERHHTGSCPSADGELLLIRIRRMHQLMTQAVQKFAGNAIDTELTLGKLTVTHVRNLIAVSEHASIGQAARSIGISEQSLHHAITDLEKLLRKPLLIHRPAGTTISQQGAMLASRLHLALGEIRLGFEEIQDRRGIVNSKILIGSQSASGVGYLARAIDRLLKAYPQVTVDVVEAPYRDLLTSLIAGKIDFLFDLLMTAEDVSEIVQEPLYQDNFVVVSAPDHPIRNALKVDRTELSQYEWIVSPPDTARFQALQRLLGNSTSKVRLIAGSRELTRALLIGSDRLTILTRQEALAEERLGTLTSVPGGSKIRAPALGIASRKSWLPTKMQQIFLQIIRDVIREQKQPQTQS